MSSHSANPSCIEKVFVTSFNPLGRLVLYSFGLSFFWSPHVVIQTPPEKVQLKVLLDVLHVGEIGWLKKSKCLWVKKSAPGF